MEVGAFSTQLIETIGSIETRSNDLVSVLQVNVDPLLFTARGRST